MFGAIYKLVTGRDPRWRKLRREWLKDYPFCLGCGRDQDCVPHHIVPVHIDSSRELDRNNLVTFCPDCHLTLGHGGNWQHWVDDCEQIAATLRHAIRKADNRGA